MESPPDEFKWTPESVENFWSNLSTSAEAKWNYFALQRGQAVIKLCRQYVPLGDNILDVGCGPGHLIRYLLQDQLSCAGTDLSEKSIEQLNREFDNHPLFNGALLMDDPLHIPFESSSISTVFFLETIEHLFDDQIEAILSEIKRVLQPGGGLVITTPFDEDLKSSYVNCPQCNCNFHPIQHMQSWNVEKLERLMLALDLKKKYCASTYLRPNIQVGLMSFISRSEGTTTSCPSCNHAFKPEQTKASFLTRLCSMGQHQSLVWIGSK